MARHIIKRDDLYQTTQQEIKYKKTDLEERKEAYVNHDHPSTIENGTATLWYIIVMAAGTIFVSRWLIWIVASFIYFRFINRHKIREKQWDKKQEEKRGGHN